MSEFDALAQSWDDNPERLERASAVAAAIMREAKLTPADVVLEYGAGTGVVGRLLAPNAGQVHLVDAAAEMVAVAQRKAAEAGLDNVWAEQRDLTAGQTLDSRYDLVTATLVLHHIADAAQLLDQFARLLRPGGRLALADLDRDVERQYHDEGFAGHHGFDRGELAAQLASAGFVNLRWETVYQMPKTTKSGHRRVFPIFLVVANLATAATDAG